MKGSVNPKVKICCISSLQEAQSAIELGASALGLVSKMPSGPGVISDDKIKHISDAIPADIDSFLLTSETSASEIITQYKRLNTRTIQLVDDLKEGSYQQIRDQLPDVRLVQVIHVMNEEAVAAAVHASHFVDAILLDSGNPKLKTKVLGGTGTVHNWDISRTIREELQIPMFLAGGLNCSNVKAAINHVQPYGLDLCSGVRTNGRLDESKLAEFFAAISRVI